MATSTSDHQPSHQHTHKRAPAVKRDQSKGAKERIAVILEKDIEECGKVAACVRRHSLSKEILLKSAKQTASQEVSMDVTLAKLRLVESLLNKALDQADNVGRSMEQTADVLSQIHHLTD